MYYVYIIQVKQIVMLTDLVEKGRSKCEAYFPQEVGSELHSGPYFILCISIRQLGECTVRDLLINTPHSSQRIVTHYWYPAWADHKLANPRQLLDIALSVLHLEDTPTEHNTTSEDHPNFNCGHTTTLDTDNAVKFTETKTKNNLSNLNCHTTTLNADITTVFSETKAKSSLSNFNTATDLSDLNQLQNYDKITIKDTKIALRLPETKANTSHSIVKQNQKDTTKKTTEDHQPNCDNAERLSKTSNSSPLDIYSANITQKDISQRLTETKDSNSLSDVQLLNNCDKTAQTEILTKTGNSSLLDVNIAQNEDIDRLTGANDSYDVSELYNYDRAKCYEKSGRCEQSLQDNNYDIQVVDNSENVHKLTDSDRNTCFSEFNLRRVERATFSDKRNQKQDISSKFTYDMRQSNKNRSNRYVK